MKYLSHLYNDQSVKERRRALRKNQTDTERRMWSILRNKQIKGIKFLRQYSVGPYILDFYCPAKRLAIEVDGGQHTEDDHRRYDQRRSIYLAQNDINVLRFWDNDVLKNIDGVWEKINEVLRQNL